MTPVAAEQGERELNLLLIFYMPAGPYLLVFKYLGKSILLPLLLGSHGDSALFLMIIHCCFTSKHQYF